MILVTSDQRWPLGTGIGVCQDEYLSRVPDDIRVSPLALKSRIGDPLSPLTIASAVSRHLPAPDVFWSPGFLPPAWGNVPSVVTVHDLIHLHFHSRAHRIYYDHVLRRLYRRCDAVICVSDHTMAEFVEWSGMDAGRVHVVYDGVSEVFRPRGARADLGHRYIFYPGNKRKHKNLLGTLRAYARSSLACEGVALVMTGEPTAELASEAERLKLGAHVRFLGKVDANVLPSLYRGAEFTVFISLYEGFGLPLIESMAVGTPVLTSCVSSMPEVAGGAAYEVDPLDCDGVAYAMNRLLHDSAVRGSLIAKGLKRAKRFSWEASATQTWNIVRSCAGRAA